MNHLSKLKLNGKTVGYEQVSHGETPDTGEPCLSWVYSKDGKEWTLEPILHDEKCKFVTKDKNGKDVFAGDDNIKHDLYQDQLGKVVWCKNDLRWEIFFTLTRHRAHIRLDEQLEKAENIELIEEQE